MWPQNGFDAHDNRQGRGDCGCVSRWCMRASGSGCRATQSLNADELNRNTDGFAMISSVRDGGKPDPLQCKYSPVTRSYASLGVWT